MIPLFSRDAERLTGEMPVPPRSASRLTEYER